jgi:guanine deaminase
VSDLFPECDSYASVYDHYGVLGPKTILAHAVHISESEADLIKDRGSGISHCPVSNSALTSGMARVRWMLDKGLNVGLGTDVSGGFSPSVLVAAREASCVSRCVAAGTGQKEESKGDERDKLSVEEVLYLATRGGAKVVGMEGKIGGFEVGMQWDAQLVGLGAPVMKKSEDGEDGMWEDGNEKLDGVGCAETGPVDIFGWETWQERVAKWVFNGDDRNTLKVWVRGRLVHERVRI